MRERAECKAGDMMSIEAARRISSNFDGFELPMHGRQPRSEGRRAQGGDRKNVPGPRAPEPSIYRETMIRF
jgi:hypothetical protein